MLPWVVILLLGCAPASGSGVVYQSLDSSEQYGVWTFLYPNTSTWYPSTVPGQLHLDLLASGLIEEPYSELNVDVYSWIKHTPWSLTCAFTPTPSLLSKRRVLLVFEGIDTVSNVSLNGKALFSTSSAFIQYSVDVTEELVSAAANGGGPQEISVRIASPTDFAAGAAAACTGFCPSPEWGPASNLSSYDQASTYLNKPLVHAGWDFAPNFAPSGVWKSVYLLGVDSVELEEVGVVTTPSTLPVPLSPNSSSSTLVSWTLNITAFCRVPPNPTNASPFDAKVEVAVFGLPPGCPSSASTLAQLTPGVEGQTVVVSLTIPSGVLPWWPHGLGLPTLYNTSVTLASVGDGGVSQKTLRVGFRTVALSQPPTTPTTTGSLYVFSVNGHALFIKGANWVPPDAFPARASATSHVTPRLTSFVQAGYNTLRVWGGGYPASTELYEVAQAMGLLVWQEMPYACMLSPTGLINGGVGWVVPPPPLPPYAPTYLSNAHQATLFTIQRLQKFSILLWGGNNEVAEIGKFDVPATATNYSALYFGAIGATMAALDASRRFVPSSPGSGTETASAPIPSPPVSYFAGDVHFYTYGANCWDPRQFPRPRAASEFGWQSYSSLPSLAELVGPAGWDYWSPPIQRRDTHAGQPPATILFHNIGQNWRIPGYNGTSPFSQPQDRDGRLRGRAADLAGAARAAGSVNPNYSKRGDGTYALPTDASNMTGVMGSYGGVGAQVGTVFRDTLLLTQLSQAQCVKTEAEKYRRLQSDCGEGGGGGGGVDTGGGCTSVLLYWMSADLWPGATKGSLEWSGRWKALHYEAAERFLAPLLLSPWVFRDWEGGVSSAPFGVTLAAHAPASLHTPIPNGTLRTQCWSWAEGLLGASYSGVVVESWGNASSAWEKAGDVSASGGSVALELEGGGGVNTTTTLGEVLASCGCPSPSYSPNECVLTFDLFGEVVTSSPTTPPLASNYLLPTPINTVSTMQVPQLAITDVVDNGVLGGVGSFNITVTAVGLPVAFVWIESLLCCGHFSTNAFLMTQSPMLVTYFPGEDARGWAWAGAGGSGNKSDVSPGQFAASLSIWSLAETAVGYIKGR